MKKIRKFIGFILLLLILVIILILQIPFSFVNSKPNTEYDNVLSTSITNMNAKIVDIALLGSHDSFSDGIKYSSKSNTNEGGITNNKIVSTVAKGLVVKMSKAQVCSAKEQLYAGIRYFDVRITKIDGIYYTCHGYLSNKLEIYIKEIVDFLDEHPGEFIIFDLQHFYTENGDNYNLEKDEYENLVEYMDSIKSSKGNSILDYLNYDSKIDSISSLTYGTITKNKSKAGIIMLAKVKDYSYLYERDSDASYERSEYKNIFSLWHNTNSIKTLISEIEKEIKYLKENDYSNILRVNQAQRTGFIMDASLIKSLFEWSILDMARWTNKNFIKDEETFKMYLSKMPIFMVDFSTSNFHNFNKLANKYISEYNSGL